MMISQQFLNNNNNNNIESNLNEEQVSSPTLISTSPIRPDFNLSIYAKSLRFEILESNFTTMNDENSLNNSNNSNNSPLNSINKRLDLIICNGNLNIIENYCTSNNNEENEEDDETYETENEEIEEYTSDEIDSEEEEEEEWVQSSDDDFENDALVPEYFECNNNI